MIKTKLFLLLIIIFLCISCGDTYIRQVLYWENDDNGKIYANYRYLLYGPDMEYTENDSVFYYLLNVNIDCSQQIHKFDVSDNDQMVAFHINRGNKECLPYGTLLAVFDLENKNVEELIIPPILKLDSVEIIDFELYDSLITYTLADSSMVDYLFY